MSSTKSESVSIRSSEDIVLVRQRVREMAVSLAFGLVDQTKIVTAASEIARNTLDYGKGGTATIEALEDGIKRGVRLTFQDSGPGIPDVEMALRDGYTTGSGMGLGLGGSRRLVHEFEIESHVGRGTRVTIVRWR
jgi:serine/threonine-protein kinase RsbT